MSNDLSCAEYGCDFDECDDESFARGDDGECATCNGTGIVITCIDDICHGGDGCIHGDGEDPCGDCYA